MTSVMYKIENGGSFLLSSVVWVFWSILAYGIVLYSAFYVGNISEDQNDLQDCTLSQLGRLQPTDRDYINIQ